MTHKIVSQLDTNGVFIGPTIADESPLEPGVFHIPGGAVDIEPPIVPDGKLARFVSGEFVFEDAPVIEEMPTSSTAA
jgi:hypothetical protein